MDFIEGFRAMRVAITEFRRKLGFYTTQVQAGAGPVVIVAHGAAVGALISMEQLSMMWLAEDELHKGPVDVNTGRRPGVWLWRRMRSMLSKNGEQYLTEAEKRDLEVKDEERRMLNRWRDAHPLRDQPPQPRKYPI